MNRTIRPQMGIQMYKSCQLRPDSKAARQGAVRAWEFPQGAYGAKMTSGDSPVYGEGGASGKLGV